MSNKTNNTIINMANEKWKALYEYEYSPVLWMFYFMSGIGGLCIIIMALFFAHNSDEKALVVVLASPITIMSIFLTISQSASTVRNRMYKYGVEFVCKKKGLLLRRKTPRTRRKRTRRNDRNRHSHS